MKIINLDLDEVLVDNYKSVTKFKNIEYPYSKPENLGKYEIHAMVGQEWAEYWESITEDQWANMDKFPWADDLVNMVLSIEKQLKGLVKLRFITAPVFTTACFAGKMRWIEKHYPKLKYRLCIAGDKQDFVSHDDILIDDSEKNELKFINADKHNSFLLFPSVGNRLYELVPKNDAEIKILIDSIKAKILNKIN